MHRPYWYAYMQTKKWEECFYKIEASETEEELKEATQELLIGYDSFIEKMMEDDGRWAQEDMLED